MNKKKHADSEVRRVLMICFNGSNRGGRNAGIKWINHGRICGYYFVGNLGKTSQIKVC